MLPSNPDQSFGVSTYIQKELELMGYVSIFLSGFIIFLKMMSLREN